VHSSKKALQDNQNNQVDVSEEYGAEQTTSLRVGSAGEHRVVVHFQATYSLQPGSM
jgi:hypothetical protein